MIKQSQISLVALLYFYFRILLSRFANLDVFLSIEEFLMAIFCESRARIPRRFIVEQVIKISY